MYLCHLTRNVAKKTGQKWKSNNLCEGDITTEKPQKLLGTGISLFQRNPKLLKYHSNSLRDLFHVGNKTGWNMMIDGLIAKLRYLHRCLDVSWWMMVEM